VLSSEEVIRPDAVRVPLPEAVLCARAVPAARNSHKSNRELPILDVPLLRSNFFVIEVLV